MSFEAWNTIVATNLSSVFLCAREALRRMKPLRRGRIITIGSISAEMPRPNAIGYAATKGAIHSMNQFACAGWAGFWNHCVGSAPGRYRFGLSKNMEQRPRNVTMATEDVARAALLMAALPNETNVFELTMLPVNQPYLGRS